MAWLNDGVLIAVGARRPSGVSYDVYLLEQRNPPGPPQIGQDGLCASPTATRQSVRSLDTDLAGRVGTLTLAV